MTETNEEKLRRARQMWSGPFPELFTPDGDLRRQERGLLAYYMALGFFVMVLFVIAAVFAVLAWEQP